MSEQTQDGRGAKVRKHGRDGYRMVIRNTRDNADLVSYRLTPINVYVALSTLLVVVALIVYLIIAFTPLREYIPGYGSVVQQEEVAELRHTLTELGSLVEAQDLYIENMKRTVLGKATTVDSVEDRTAIVAATIDPLPPSAEELQLRRDMEQERRGQRDQAATAPLPSPGSDDVPLAQVYLVPPVNGEISAAFNLINEHTGVDILAPRNTAIKATRAGIVFMAEFTNANGNVIGIQHDNNLISFYKHNAQLLKEVGDRVRAGEAIAIIGDTGTQSSGPHLHFELWHEGRVVDPGEYVSF